MRRLEILMIKYHAFDPAVSRNLSCGSYKLVMAQIERLAYKDIHFNIVIEKN